MGLEGEILEISNDNYTALSAFIESLNEEQESFRYFKTRGREALENHLFTFLALQDNTPVGYGHLDGEAGVVWLGVVVKQEYQGKGLGMRIVEFLIEKAKELELPAIQLSVDNSNERAINLYNKIGFELLQKKDAISIMKKRITSTDGVLQLGISTLAFKGIAREEITAIATQNNWMIEFSSSFPHQEDMEEFFINSNVKRLAHNYFPAPLEPFVLNLASANEAIRRRSIDHCISGLEISKKAGAPCFSAHAGFCIDPDPKALGSQLNVNVPINRDHHWDLFITAVKEIVAKAKSLGLSFFIENNVTAPFNLREDKQEVLLCSQAHEMVKLCDIIDSDQFGILLDTAHLKVSSQALDFDINSAVSELEPYIKYIHHSDNDGQKDTNERVGQNYWFLPWMNKFEHCIHILEVKNISQDLIKEQIEVLNSYETE